MSFTLDVRDWDLIAGIERKIQIPATFFQIMQATGGIELKVLREHSVIGEADGAPEGFKFGGPNAELFHEIALTSDTTQTVKLCFARGHVDLQRIVGTVEVSSLTNNGAATQASAATGADAQILAANASRRYLALQNIGAADIYFTIDGGAADATGLKLGAGQMIVYDAWVPTGAIRAYSASASTLAYCEA